MIIFRIFLAETLSIWTKEKKYVREKESEQLTKERERESE